MHSRIKTLYRAFRDGKFSAVLTTGQTGHWPGP